MNELQIALALAVSMLIFSTLVATVFEIFYRVFKFRRKGLKKMLSNIYENELKSKFINETVHGNENSSNGEDSTGKKENFIENMMKLTGGSGTLPTLDFIRKLADTDIGKSIGKRSNSEIDSVIDDIASRFEEYGQQASENFRDNAQTFTVLISVVVALFLNINVITLVRTFQNDKILTHEIAGQAQQAMAAYQVEAAYLQKSLDNPNDGEKKVEDLKRKVNDLEDKIIASKALGLPFGWTGDRIGNYIDIQNFLSRPDFLMNWVCWIITTVITGFMIGLGGPFWFDMVKRLSLVSRLAGAGGRQPDPQKVQESKNSQNKILDQDPKTAFKTAIRAQIVVDRIKNGIPNSVGPSGARY